MTKEKLGFSHTLKKNDSRKEKFTKQRKERGWDDSELWNLDITIAKLVYPRLKRFKEIAVGYPASLTNEKWDEILDKMIKAFELMATDDSEYYTGIQDDGDNSIKEGLDLFREYFHNLWI